MRPGLTTHQCGGVREGCRHPHWDPSTEEMVENEPRETPVSPSFLKKEWLSHLKSRAVLVPRPSSPPPPHYPHSRKLHPPLLHSWKLDLLLSILHPPATSHPNLEGHNPWNPSHSISTEPELSSILISLLRNYPTTLCPSCETTWDSPRCQGLLSLCTGDQVSSQEPPPSA